MAGLQVHFVNVRSWFMFSTGLFGRLALSSGCVVYCIGKWEYLWPTSPLLRSLIVLPLQTQRSHISK